MIPKEEIKFYSKEECKEPYVRLNKVGNTNNSGRYVSSTPKIGPMVKTYSDNMCRIKSYEDFYNIWINETLPKVIKNKPKYNDVFEYIQDLIEEFKSKCNTDISYEELYKYFLFLAIYSTTFGVSVENLFAEKNGETGKYVVVHSNSYEDAKLGIDLLFLNPSTMKPEFLVQVKPISFVSTNKGEHGLLPTRLNYFNEVRRAEEKYNAPVYFVFYMDTKRNYTVEDVEWVINPYTSGDYPSKHCFKYDEVCFRNGFISNPKNVIKENYNKDVKGENLPIWELPRQKEIDLF